MKQKSTYFKVGLFVLLCSAAIVAVILYVSADRLPRDVARIETYVDESVHGLSVGSAVLHRGVQIGRVEKITFVQAEYPMELGSEEFEKFARYVMVVVAIDLNRIPALDVDPDSFAQMLAAQVSMGLRFKLTSQGITGMSFLEADYVDPERHPVLDVPWEPENFYVPSTPSLFTSFAQAIENVFQRLERIDFEGLFAQFDKTLQSSQKTLEDADIGAIRESAVAMMDEFKTTNEQIRDILVQTDEPMPGNFPAAVQKFSDTMERMDSLLERHEMDIDEFMKNLKPLMESLRQISDIAKDNPARLLFSEPPEHSEFVK